jgi:tetratricopeptide (TPR) repeat protein
VPGETIFDSDEYTKPCIVNDHENIIDDINKLKIILKSIFSVKNLEEKHEELLQVLLNNKSQLSSYESVITVLRTYLMNQANSGVNLEKYIQMLSQTSLHEIETNNNRMAYNPQAKKFPGAVIWPNPTDSNSPASLFETLPMAVEHKIVDKTVPIGSAGSCFAMEIAIKLQEEGFNYVLTESNPYGEQGFQASCAHWGIIFNAPSLRQIVEKSFGIRKLPKIIFTLNKNGKTIYHDPFREDVEFTSVEEYEENYEKHLVAAREALSSVKIFIITLGMNEVWFLKSDKSVLSRSPWRLASYLVEKKVLTVDENVNELQKMLDTWRIFNPDLKLIISVSPVPLHATFRGNEQHVVTANAHSKAVLRVAAETFAGRNEGVYYFPSYETVMYCTENAWEPDQRHVSRKAVANVMKLFENMFVKEEEVNDELMQKLFIKGKGFLQAEDYPEAEKIFKRLNEYSPGNNDFLLNLGQAQFSQEKHEDAINTFSGLLRNGICTYEICHNLAISLAQIGDRSTAEIYFKKAHELKNSEKTD